MATHHHSRGHQSNEHSSHGESQHDLAEKFAKEKADKHAMQRKMMDADLCAELCDGRLIPLDLKKNQCVGDLKRTLCLEGGYDPDQHGLKFKGKLLDDASTLADAGVKKNQVLRLAFTMQLKRKKSLWELTSADTSPVKSRVWIDTDDEEEEVKSSKGSSSGSESSADEAYMAFKKALKDALTEEEFHAKCISPKANKRRESRKLAQEKATSRRRHKAKHMPLLLKADDLVSVLSEVAQTLLPDIFLNCTPMSAKSEDVVQSLPARPRPSAGGA